jgi:fibro-slime domain-containing protein
MRKALVLLALIACSFADPRTIVLHTLLRDFDPPSSPHGHPDFETYLGDSRGAVGATLDQDGKPFLKDGTWPCFTSQAAFAQWYRDSDRSVSVANDITLTETGDGTGIFEYANGAYFPLDGKGWPPGYYLDSGHNFHFTTEVHTVFTFLGNETFTFTGDDDLFVYINGNLAIDLGGVHSAETATLDLSQTALQTQLGLAVGQDATLAVFGAERHTTESHFTISTSLQLVSTTPNVTNTDPYICGIQIPNFGAGVPADQVPLYPEFRYFNIDESLASFDNFNVIVFGDWTSGTGDTE